MFFVFCVFKNLFIYLFLLLAVLGLRFCTRVLYLRQAGATLHRGARASHYRSLSCCGAQAPDAQAQSLWLMGVVTPWHVGSSQTRARTRVPCIGRQTLNHCATREAPQQFFIRQGVFFPKTNTYLQVLYKLTWHHVIWLIPIKSLKT